MPIAAFAAFSLVQHLYGHELALFVPGDDHLCDALSVVHDEIFLRESTVPGEFSTVIPFFRASPLRGLT